MQQNTIQMQTNQTPIYQTISGNGNAVNQQKRHQQQHSYTDECKQNNTHSPCLRISEQYTTTTTTTTIIPHTRKRSSIRVHKISL